MQSVHHDTWDGDTVHTTIAVEDAQTLFEDRRGGTFTVTLGDVDLPAFFSHGRLYVQAPLPHIFEAFAENLPAFLRDMEIRISDERGRPFSLDCHGHPVLSTGLAEPRVVSGRRYRR
jgi:hypothetical protein